MRPRDFAPTTLPAALDHLLDVCPPGPLSGYDRVTYALAGLGLALLALMVLALLLELTSWPMTAPTTAGPPR